MVTTESVAHGKAVLRAEGRVGGTSHQISTTPDKISLCVLHHPHVGDFFWLRSPLLVKPSELAHNIEPIISSFHVTFASTPGGSSLGGPPGPWKILLQPFAGLAVWQEWRGSIMHNYFNKGECERVKQTQIMSMKKSVKRLMDIMAWVKTHQIWTVVR